MLPSLGGVNTLRSYTDYRFHDRNMLLANAELRLAMMTHVDLAVFADAGNVAPRFEELDLDKQSFGAGLRFHTRRQTFARIDVGQRRRGLALPVPPDRSAGAQTPRTRAPLVPLVSVEETMMRVATLVLTAITSAPRARASAGRRSRTRRQPPGASMWVEPTDLASRDLYYGPWGARARAGSEGRLRRWSSSSTPASISA